MAVDHAGCLVNADNISQHHEIIRLLYGIYTSFSNKLQKPASIQLESSVLYIRWHLNVKQWLEVCINMKNKVLLFSLCNYSFDKVFWLRSYNVCHKWDLCMVSLSSLSMRDHQPSEMRDTSALMLLKVWTTTVHVWPISTAVSLPDVSEWTVTASDWRSRWCVSQISLHTHYTLCSEKKTPTHIFFHISMNYLWI